MIQKARTPKPAYFKAGSWQLLEPLGLWLQREPTGPLWLCGGGGIFLALRLESACRVQVLSNGLLIKQPMQADGVAMGQLSVLGPHLPSSLQQLMRRHPGLLRPTTQVVQRPKAFLSYISESTQLKLCLASGQGETSIQLEHTAPLKMVRFWRHTPPLPPMLASYCSWYVQACLDAFTTSQLPTMLNFTKLAAPYLSRPAQLLLKRKLATLLETPTALLKHLPAGADQFIEHAKAAAILSWYNTRTKPAMAWQQPLFDGDLKPPKDLQTAVMALATPINPL